MKFFFALIIANVIGYAALASDSPQIVSTTFKNIYVPKGFDTNDNVQITAEGVFSNSCYKIAPSKFSVDERNKVVTLDAQAYEYKGMCIQMLTPFQQVIDIGIIKTPGLYKIQSGSGVLLGQLELGRAISQTADEHLYAPVFRVNFEDGLDNTVSMRIEFNHSCLQLSEIKVDRQEKVIVILPIAKLVPDFGCAIGYYPLEEKVKIGALARGRYLLHVRSSGSQAFNQIISVE